MCVNHLAVEKYKGYVAFCCLCHLGKEGPFFNNYVSLLEVCHMILQSSWCFEVHANSWLSDLKVGKATEILQEEEKAFKIQADKQD